MIRTATVNLTTIPAIAFRQKLKDGGSGVVIMRADSKQPGIASISKTSGKAIPAKNNPAKMFPEDSFNEAIQLTIGMPYTKRKGVQFNSKKKVEEVADTSKEKLEEEILLDDKDYKTIVKTYTDKTGKLSYELLNKDLIQFAHRSKKVSEFFADRKSVKTVRNYIIWVKFSNISGNKDLDQKQAIKIADLLDEAYPKGVFKELNAELRKAAAAAKKA